MNDCLCAGLSPQFICDACFREALRAYNASLDAKHSKLPRATRAASY